MATEYPWSYLITSPSQPAPTEEEADTPPQWRLTDIVIGVVILGTLQFIQVVLFVGGEGPRARWGISAELFKYFPTLLTAYVVLVLAHRRGMRLPHLGFTRPHSWKPSLYAWAGAVLAGPLWLAVLALVGQDAGSVGGAVLAATPFERLLRVPVVLYATGVVVVAPVVEEVIFRGLIFRGLRQRLPLLLALAGTGIIFAAFHFDPERFVPLVVVGALFAWAYDRTGSLWASIVPHAGLNAMVLVIAFLN